jgi:hypothetical protein
VPVGGFWRPSNEIKINLLKSSACPVVLIDNFSMRGYHAPLLSEEA